jgi:hypothetical protein
MYLVIDRTKNAAIALSYAAFIRSAGIPVIATQYNGQPYVVWKTRIRPPALDCRDIQPVSKTVLGKVD